MKLKKALFKDTIKEITSTYKRFISIMLMSLLGVGFFAGLRATSPDMIDTIDQYFKQQNVYDIQIMSTTGLVQDDIEKIEQIDSVKDVYGSYSNDGLIEVEEKEYVSKILCLDEVNKPVLLEGNMPQNDNECVVEKKFFEQIDKHIGDTIEIKTQEYMDYLNEKELKIVGIVESPLYVSSERGTTKLGTGQIDSYIYVTKENIIPYIYTEIYVTIEGTDKYKTNSKQYEDKVDEVKGKIEDLSEEENLNWYIFDRNQNSGYSSFIQDTESIEKLSLVFPIVFFAIAVLVSLTSMTRMVEEERQEIGTLKALGYSGYQIASKYVIYASFACIIGGIIGMNIGFQLLPRMIWEMYTVMYQMPEINISYNHENAILGLGLIYICVVGATCYSIIKEVKETPATLLRPKAPKIGKRVLLERITPIWKRLNFSQKVTVRNIFRYKKRFLMTIIGIFGCTSLILAGFGLKDSISKLLPNQYEKVFNYEMQISLKTDLTEEQKEEWISEISKKEEVEKIAEIYMTSTTVEDNDVQIIVPKTNDELKDIINLIDYKTENNEIRLQEQDGVVITEKLAELLDVKEGDTIKIREGNNKEKELKISMIAENYIYHYIYMSKENYEKIYDQDYSTNVILVKDKELNEKEQDDFSTEIISQNEVSTVILTSDIMGILDNTMNSLNYVVLILIVSAGLLAFVVLYNLSNVNISERVRELATIKVLGFYDKEVYSYVTRETILLTIIGIILGLVGGYFLNFYIIGTCEIDAMRFPKVIDPISYVYAVLITVVFTVIVNIATYFALKKIDMIGSLKSVE